MIYVLVNPSDPYTLEADDVDVAFVACCFLGEGKYGLKPCEPDGLRIPVFIMGGTEEWCLINLGKTMDAIFEEVVNGKREQLIACLESLVIGGIDQRLDFQAATDAIADPSARDTYRAGWHNRHRTSMNDIGASAQRLATLLREREPAEVQS